MLYKLLLWCSNKLPGMRSTFSTIQYSLPQICNDLSQFPDTALDGVMEKRSKMESLVKWTNQLNFYLQYSKSVVFAWCNVNDLCSVFSASRFMSQAFITCSLLLVMQINLKRPSLQIQYWMYLQLNHQIYNGTFMISESWGGGGIFFSVMYFV